MPMNASSSPQKSDTRNLENLKTNKTYYKTESKLSSFELRNFEELPQEGYQILGGVENLEDYTRSKIMI